VGSVPPDIPEVTVSDRPLLATADNQLLDDMLRLAAAAGVELNVCHDPGDARRCWSAAPLCLVGTDLAAGLARLEPARRPHVVLVGRDLDDADVWRLAHHVGADHVVFLPDAERWLVEQFAEAADGRSSAGAAVCVVGGRGGAGASTLAAALAVTAARQGLRAMLVDGDPLGGGIDLVLGGEESGGLRWPDLGDAHGRVRASMLREALPRVGELTILSWDRGDTVSIPLPAMQTVLGAAFRGNDLVVVDLPRRLDEAAAEAARHATVTLLVVPAEVRATASAARVAASLALVTSDVRIVVRGPGPSRLPADVIADSLGLPLAGQIRDEPAIVAALERGEPPARRGRGSLADFSVAFLDEMILGWSREAG
jgi:secretion/DNA translocation related CpaE-like protein